MTGNDSDSEFDDFLARRSPLHRRLGDGDGHEPPAELDRIVLRKAREAIRRPSETPVYRSPQWAMPVGLAASVLLIFAVVLNFARVTRQPGMATPPMAANAPTAAPAAASERARMAEEGASAEPLADSKAEADAAPVAALASRDALLAKETAAPPPALRAEQETPPIAPGSAGRVSSPPLASIASSAKRSAAVPSVEVRAAMHTPTSLAGTPIPAAEPSEIQDLTAGGSVLARSPAAGAAESLSVPPAAPAVAQAAPPAESSETANSPLMAANAAEAASDQSARSDEVKKAYTASNTASPGATAIGALEEVTTVGARRVRGGTKRPATSSTPAAIAAEKARHPDADAWLREIEAIRAAGHDADARRELEAFRKAYPDHPVPLSKDEPPPAE